MLGTLLQFVKTLRFIPHIIVFQHSPLKELLVYERDRWMQCNRFPQRGGTKDFLLLLEKFPEYRSLFYHRTGCRWLRHFAKGQTNLYFHTPQERIGKGLVLWHAYSTVINADSMGEDCEVWHNVTIGKKTTAPVNDRPRIGHGVKVCTGAIVVGDIEIANGVTIGAGTTLTKSIPQENATVVGSSARIL